MKKNIFLLALLMSATSVLPTMDVGELTEYELIYPGFFETDYAYWASDSQDYVNGGITFTFPEGFFSDTPRVFVTVEVFNYSQQGIVSAQIVYVDATSVTIRLNVVAGSTVGEAQNNTAKISIFAVGH